MTEKFQMASRRGPNLIVCPPHSAIEQHLQQRLRGCFVVYGLGKADLSSTPWAAQCAALVLTDSAEPIPTDGATRTAVQNFINAGGKLFHLCQEQSAVDQLVSAHCVQVSPTEPLELQCDLIEQALGARLHAPVLPALTTAVLWSTDAQLMTMLMSRLGPHLRNGRLAGSKMSLLFTSDAAAAATERELPVIAAHNAPLTGANFNFATYAANLRSAHIGHLVLFADVVTSTMHHFEGMSAANIERPVVSICRQQTGGEGRGGNRWISNDGCAMFSLMLRFGVASPLGASLSLLQQVMSLAAVLAARRFPRMQQADIRLKWPNDIYYGNRTKIGGVLVNCSLQGAACTAVIGCGVNVSNEQPTVCLNSMQRSMRDDGHPDAVAAGDGIGVEAFIACTLTEFERLVHLIMQDRCQQLIDLYHQHWLHSGQQVTVANGAGGSFSGTVVGIDNHGFLRVQQSADAAGLRAPPVVAVHPDGNRFDMMRNLICPK